MIKCKPLLISGEVALLAGWGCAGVALKFGDGGAQARGETESLAMLLVTPGCLVAMSHVTPGCLWWALSLGLAPLEKNP